MGALSEEEHVQEGCRLAGSLEVGWMGNHFRNVWTSRMNTSRATVGGKGVSQAPLCKVV